MLNLQAIGAIRKPVRTGSVISRKVVQPETLAAAFRAAAPRARQDRQRVRVALHH